MLSIVKGSRYPRQTLEYNEQKLEQQQAQFIGAFNYWEDQLQWVDKYQRLHERALRNERVRTHTAHISLNFHPGDDLPNQKMKIIASPYLKAIGFADQPALVYRHLDAGHPHLHIVTSNIRPDGTRITNDLRSPYNLRKICHHLEETHHLIPVDQRYQLKDTHTIRLKYGQTPTRTRIENILNTVLEKYAYTSVDHLNAVLKLYNMMADRGSEDSTLYHNRGLYYRALDDEGRRIGAPIKASALDSHPTLDYLELKFKQNQTIVQEKNHRQFIAASIEFGLFTKQNQTLDQFTRYLEQKRIQIVPDLPRPRYVKTLEKEQTQKHHQRHYLRHGLY